MKTKSPAHGAKKAAHLHFGFRATASDAPHIFTAMFSRNRVYHGGNEKQPAG